MTYLPLSATPGASHKRLGMLFYNEKIVIPEAMRTSIIAMLRRGHVAITNMDQAVEAFW